MQTDAQCLPVASSTDWAVFKHKAYLLLKTPGKSVRLDREESIEQELHMRDFEEIVRRINQHSNNILAFFSSLLKEWAEGDSAKSSINLSRGEKYRQIFKQFKSEALFSQELSNLDLTQPRSFILIVAPWNFNIGSEF